MSQSKEPSYKIVTSEEHITIRDYPPMILAEVQTRGERREAIREGFKILADYIFGNNTSKTKMDPPTHITTETNEKISMTIPVMQEECKNLWKVRFVMPSEYNLQTIPSPNRKEVTLINWPAKRFAVIQFSGTPDDEIILSKTQELKAYILSQHLNMFEGVILAFYNPPWTLPFLRRNEIMIQLHKD